VVVRDGARWGVATRLPYRTLCLESPARGGGPSGTGPVRGPESSLSPPDVLSTGPGCRTDLGAGIDPWRGDRRRVVEDLPHEPLAAPKCASDEPGPFRSLRASWRVFGSTNAAAPVRTYHLSNGRPGGGHSPGAAVSDRNLSVPSCARWLRGAGERSFPDRLNPGLGRGIVAQWNRRPCRGYGGETEARGCSSEERAPGRPTTTSWPRKRSRPAQECERGVVVRGETIVRGRAMARGDPLIQRRFPSSAAVPPGPGRTGASAHRSRSCAGCPSGSPTGV
jgi:hypothetical protein